jgi:hypothetical protein
MRLAMRSIGDDGWGFVLFYNLDHYLYTIKVRPCADSAPSADLVFSTARPFPPILQLDVEWEGVIPGREKDQFGVGLRIKLDGKETSIAR